MDLAGERTEAKGGRDEVGRAGRAKPVEYICRKLGDRFADKKMARFGVSWRGAPKDLGYNFRIISRNI